MPLTVFPTEAEFSNVSKSETRSDITDGVHIALVELLLHDRLLGPIDEGDAGDSVLQVVAKPRCY